MRRREDKVDNCGFLPHEAQCMVKHDYTQSLTTLSQGLEGQVPMSPSCLKKSGEDNYSAFD